MLNILVLEKEDNHFIQYWREFEKNRKPIVTADEMRFVFLHYSLETISALPEAISAYIMFPIS